MKDCLYCDSSKTVRNGFYRIKVGKPVLRYKCQRCGKSFRTSSICKKRELRGRKRKESAAQSQFSKILEDLISYYSYRKNLSFYKAAIHLTGKSRPTLRRYLTSNSYKVDEKIVISVFRKVKLELELSNGGRMSLSIYKRLQTIGNEIVKTALGPPMAHIRNNTIIWNTKSPEYREMIKKLSRK